MLKIRLYTSPGQGRPSQSKAVSEPACSSVTSSVSLPPHERALAQSDTDGLSGSFQSGTRVARSGPRVSSHPSLEPSRLNPRPVTGSDILPLACLALNLAPASTYPVLATYLRH